MSTAIYPIRLSAPFSELPLPEHAGTVVEQSEGIKTALSRGVPLHEIQAELDWLDAVNAQRGHRIRPRRAHRR